MALISDIVIAAGVTGSLALASVVAPIYLRNKRTMRKVSAEEFIENFMKRQEQEIEHKNTLIREMEDTLKKQQVIIKKLEENVYKKDRVIKELKLLVKELKAEIRTAKVQSQEWRTQLNQMKEDYEAMKK